MNEQHLFIDYIFRWCACPGSAGSLCMSSKPIFIQSHGIKLHKKDLTSTFPRKLSRNQLDVGLVCLPHLYVISQNANNSTYFLRNKASVMVQPPPTALEPVTNISLSNECFVNLIVWLTAGDQNFGHRAKNGQISEHSPNEHTRKVWKELIEKVFIQCLEIWDLTHFKPPWDQIFAHGAENHTISEHSSNKHTNKVWIELCLETSGLAILAHHGAKYVATWPKIGPFLNTHPVNTHARFKVNLPKTFRDNARKPSFGRTNGWTDRWTDVHTYECSPTLCPHPIDLARNGNSGCANEILGCAKCHFWRQSPWKWKNCGNLGCAINFIACAKHGCMGG